MTMYYVFRHILSYKQNIFKMFIHKKKIKYNIVLFPTMYMYKKELSSDFILKYLV